MNPSRILSTAAAAALLCFAQPGWSAFDPVNDDTDIFLANPQFAPSRPNVLIFVDNTANWSQSASGTTKYAGVTAALKSVLKNTVNDAYNVGLSLFVETGNPNNNTDGAYIRYGIRRMTGTADATDTTSNKALLIAMINGLDSNGDKGNGAVYSLAMAEMFKYFAGRNAYSGYGKEKADAGDTIYVAGGTRATLTGSPLPASALPSGGGTTSGYTSPIADSCQKNFIIFISNGEAADNSSSLSTATGLYTADIGTAPGTIAITPNAEAGIIADEYSKYMESGDCNTNVDGVQNVITYTIDVLPGHTGHGPDHTALLKSMVQRKGKYFAITDISNTSQIEAALTTIFQEVQSVNSVFASTTLPVSVNVRGTNLNQVYIGVFRPDPNKSPRWLGNLKLYRLAVDDNTKKLFLADNSTPTPLPAENAGFISTAASSYWTTASTYWKFRDSASNGAVPSVLPTGCTTATGNCSDLPDGNLVEKGGAAQKLRDAYASSQTARNVYTCYDGAGSLCASANYDLTLTSNAFNTTNVREVDVGAFPSVSVSTMSAAGDATVQTSAFVTSASTVPVGPSSGTGVPTSTSTITVTTQTAHNLLANDPVRIEGASPDFFNSSYYRSQGGVSGSDNSNFEFIVKEPVTATSFTYTLPQVASATIARVVATGHSLITGDLVVIDTSPNEYDTAAAGGSITKIDNNQFNYTVNSPSVAHSGPIVTQKGRKQVTALTGLNFTATATVIGHGYGLIAPTTPITNPGITITGSANGSTFDITPTTITILTADSFSYPTTSFISTAGGGTATSVQATLTMPSTQPANTTGANPSTQSHNMAASSTVRIRDTSVTGYNGQDYSVGTGPTSTTFTFTPASAVAANAGTAGFQISKIQYSQFSGGSNQTYTVNGISVTTKPSDVAKVTTTGNHTLTVGTVITIIGTQGAYDTTSSCAGHNGNFTIVGGASSPTTSPGQITSTTFYIAGNSSCASPSTGGGTAGTSYDPGNTNGTGVRGTAGAVAGFALAASNGIAQIVTATTASTYSDKTISISAITLLSTPTGVITAGNPALPATTVRDNIVNWVRGQDNGDNENENADCTISPYYPCVVSTPPVAGENSTPRTTDVRASVHGDVLHSRPAVVNYNRLATSTSLSSDIRDSDIYVYYGSNDGLLRAVKGGTTVAPTGAGPDAGLAPGSEKWSFIPMEFFGKVKRLRDQAPAISSAAQRDYFFDGSIGVYFKDAKGNGNVASPLNCVPGSCSGSDTVSGVIGDNIHPISGDKVLLFLSMRRGGEMLYALDVTLPASPKLLWRKVRGAADSAGWGELGQSWSEPKVVKLAASLGNTNNPDNVALIFGAGYQRAAEDIYPCLLDNVTGTTVTQKPVGDGSVTFTSTGSCTIAGATGSATTTTRSRGRGIFIVDAISGDVVWQAGAGVTTSTITQAALTAALALNTAPALKLNVPDMTCAIPSDVTVLDKDRNGQGDRVYVGDTCGQVWRVDISNASMLEWTVTKIASVWTGNAGVISGKRKFQFPPDLVFGVDGSGNYTAVLMGSGDREHPFDAVVTDRFYMFKDRDLTGDPANPRAGATNVSSVKISGFATAPTGAVTTDSDVFDATTANLVDGADAQGLKGWKITLAAGEKVVSNATSVAGSTFFNTNQPSAVSSGTCGSNLGIAREYAVGYADAAAPADVNGSGTVTIADRSQVHEGGGYLPSPVAVVVEIDGVKYQAVISGTSVQTPPGLTLDKRTRVFWYKEVE